MDLFSLAQAMPAPQTAQQIQEQLRQTLFAHAGTYILWLFLAQVVTVVSYWLASCVVAGEEASIKNAVKVWLLYLVITVVVFIVGGAIAAIAAGSHSEAAAGAIVVIVLLLVLFAVPMNVYAIGFLRATGFLVITIVLGVIGQAGLGVAMGTSIKDQLAVMEKLQSLQAGKAILPDGTSPDGASAPADALPGELQAGDRGRTLPERQKGLDMMYEELKKRRLALKENDQAARSKYDQQAARYLALLARLKADAGQPAQ